MSRLKKIIENLDPIEAMKALIRTAALHPHPDAYRRRIICDQCENREEDLLFGDYMCNLCDCPLRTLVNSESADKCKAKKW